MRTNQEFAQDIKLKLSDHLRPASVGFRGSFARGGFDEFSDIDMFARVHCGLTNEFYRSLEDFLVRSYGPALIRYDLDQREDTMSQSLRVSFHRLPVFWRLDLDVSSDTATDTKYPCPFPHWSVGNSALMNVIWAVKNFRRGRQGEADHYLTCACGKLAIPRWCFTRQNAATVLANLATRDDTDKVIVAKTGEVLVAPNLCSPSETEDPDKGEANCSV